jgi:fructose-bisphosphate aldolase class II
MLVNLNDILKIAEKNSYAIGSFNTPNYESLQGILSAAEELKMPVIIQHAQCHESLLPLKEAAPLMLAAARKADIPVCVHLDHGETFEYLQEALDLGFTSIMYDGSTLPYEENVANTIKAAEMAHKVGASVEAELGSMGRRESGSGNHTGAEDESKIYTDPILAKEFVSSTHIDALACSFGTTHGIYLKKPKLDFNVVKRVREETGGIPVVMHGGSGVSEEDFRSAIRAGVRKINYFTYMDKAGGTAAEEWIRNLPEGKPIFFTDLITAAKHAMKENIKTAIEIFGMKSRG